LSFIKLNSSARNIEFFPQRESPSSKDTECSECIPNYINTFVMNEIGISELNQFYREYIDNYNNIKAQNRKTENNYQKKKRELTSGMSSSLLRKLDSKINSNPLLTSKKVIFDYYGTDLGIGTLNYQFDKKEYDLIPLTSMVNEIYAEYYSSNSLYTGAKPYSYCYGSYNKCSGNGCSKIIINASSSDVVVTIKKNNRVYRHAYIRNNSSYTFNVTGGSYKVYFYYGKGWNPKKFMKNTSECGTLKGGFVSSESVGKDDYLFLQGGYFMEYSLTSMVGGNFSPESSSIDEAF